MQRSFGWLEILLFLLVVFAVAIELRLVLLLNLSWDEFHYLSRIYEHSRGELPYRLQTLHVALFSWLPRVSQSEVEQILAARWVMFAFGIGTRVLLYGIARHFVSRVGALCTVLAYSSFSYVLHHGSSFRFDPLLTFFGLNIELGPIADWSLDLEDGKQIRVGTEKFETSTPGIFAIGDINSYPGKLKLILAGFSEAAMAAHAIHPLVYPGEALHWEYSTTKGLPDG